jgi:ApbE superfamily uncharacterized protein (UPF0280 family)
MYSIRTYREHLKADRLVHFQFAYRETDLQISVDRESWTAELPRLVETEVLAARNELETYLAEDPGYGAALEPYLVRFAAPALVLEMARAANAAGVGPMAAVAGAIAERVGRALLPRVREVAVENGGDIFLVCRKPWTIGIFAGDSPFSNRVGIEIQPAQAPVGCCTSSGTVGPSLSFGRADAACVLASSTALADAAATAVGNAVRSPDDVGKGIEVAKSIPGVTGVLVIKSDQLAVWGDLKLVPVK